MQIESRVRPAAAKSKNGTKGNGHAKTRETVPAELLLNVLRAFKRGDFSVHMPKTLSGAAGDVAREINEVIDLAGRMTDELVETNHVVGREGKLGRRAAVEGAAGKWKAAIESVNTVINALAQRTSETARVIGAVATGDLSQKMELELDGRPVKGEFLRTAKLVNGMVDQLGSFASEVTRVAREVGTEGKLGGQARLKRVAGTWKDLTDSVNLMAGNLTAQVRNIAEVTTAVAKGDLSKKITADAKGEILELKNTINTMVDQLNSFASEVTRVAREVGTEGKLGGQANVRGVAGTWKDLTDNVNSMASNLTGQVRNIAEVSTAVANGDLSKKITADAKGEILQLKNTINTMVDQLNSFASEVTRVAREVGTDGRLGGQANVRGVGGTWKDLTDNVNNMASNLTGQVRNIAEVTTAIASGDLSKKITADARGEILELKLTINTMVDQLNAFAGEVTRVAREVGTEGKLGGQAQVKGVAGTWKDLTDSVNSMASNLTGQVRNIAEVTTAVAKGDLSKTITADAKGEILQLKQTINTMVDQLNSFASEVTRVAREVGTEGRLGGQAQVKGVGGTWKDLTDSVNYMASNLTGQVRNIAEVTTAVARGDLSKKITADAKGEILELKNTINIMVDQLNSFASEVTRVAREVGTEGKLGGQAQVEGVGGTWKDLTDNVNNMASNLTGQVRNIAEVTTAVARGDLSKKITADARGEILELKNTINTMVDQLNSFASEVTRVAREVGTEGRLGGQAHVKGVGGTWKDLTDNVNSMASNLTGQVRNIAEVTTAVANGDLSKKITADAKGEILELKNTINTMVDQLNSFASEVTRVAREVGTEGKLGGQAQVKGVGGTWKDLTDSVNYMASNLTDQVRGIAKVVTAVANGDLKHKLALEASGEIAKLADTINSMTETLATFAEQVTSVAREVGVEGKLGGQAKVPGAAGTWRDLTDNVNQLASNLTNQVRAIGDVATAVTKGDLTRSIAVEASGEVAALKDNINEMIRNLRETTQKTTEQDWLKTNLAKFTRMLQGQRDLVTVGQQILSELAPLVSAQHGIFYLADRDPDDNTPILKMLASYAYKERKNIGTRFRLGEGLVGQCAFEKQTIHLTNVPSDYVQINSGLGEAPPLSIVVLPVLFEGQVNAVIELASFSRFSEIHQNFLDQLTESIGIVINTIAAGMRTEGLLKQSQSLTQELRGQQEELRETNDRLERQAATLRVSEERLRLQQEELQRTNEQLGEKATLLELKNREVELAKRELEDKAEQLSVSSRYKSEFLANMSHELRTPLNSLLILSKMLADNPDSNLTGRQVEFASTIHSAGTDLLALINDILDLSKIESGTMSVEATDLYLSDLRDQVEQSFRHVAQIKQLDFQIELGANLPQTVVTDAKRLHQVLKNLLSNAFKFTERGSVALKIEVADHGWSRGHTVLDAADQVLAFTVTDTGIGIASDKQRIIFEAFQQADGTTSRKYGGTGLGLSISREIARLLGGEIKVSSTPGKGSSFTFFVPRAYHEPQAVTERSSGFDVIDLTRPGGASTNALVRAVSGTAPIATESGIEHVDLDPIHPGDKVLLIIEDDPAFAKVLMNAARERGFKAVVAPLGDLGLRLAQKLRPAAITLDLRLPDVDGWVILDQLKHDRGTRHIPVEIMSVDEQRPRAVRMGALGWQQKPMAIEQVDAAIDDLSQVVDQPTKELVLIGAGDPARNHLIEVIGDPTVEVTSAKTAGDAIALLESRKVRCVVVDRALPDAEVADLLREVQRRPALRDVPVIVNDSLRKRDADPVLDGLIAKMAGKRIESQDRLVEELALHLHRAEAELPEAQRRSLDELRRNDPQLSGRRVLIVDDDVRNIFAVTSVLEAHKIEVLHAENGKDGLALLDATPDVDAVLMDIMMPEMDGYEVIREIRKRDEFQKLPVIAVTAKAMRADREKCLQAGASDYLAKPVDPDKLLSLLRVRTGR